MVVFLRGLEIRRLTSAAVSGRSRPPLNDIFNIYHPNNFKLGAALPRVLGNTPDEFEVNRTNGSRGT